jgi:hypothetical protein
MTKNSSRQLIEAAVAERAALENEIASSQKRLAETGARIPEMAAMVDLDDAPAMAELGKLQLEFSILPARIMVKEEALAKADAGILAASEEFVRTVLNPQARAIEARARAKVEAELRQYLESGPDLIRGVEHSKLVRSAVANVMGLEANPHDGPAGYAGRVLAAWQAVEASAGKT